VGTFVTIDDDPEKITRKVVEVAQKTGSDHTQQLLVQHKDKDGALVTRVTTIGKVTIK
jgi:hypothetical protein